ncbi:hypothetical protein NE857_34030 (plasmid) [Nocardiopsis exhalans]|uniref:Uncharacterized protein n=1 Tax=Nocardiopsis exhalans TaxID=163604 RepID=A0ABY5DIZ1_9ACTN|nr:hypothetical protein [Nocardiopsis exhalans]USY23553.1 hypothetical protein NE857_34030 [Nocardiopsis exhalans]
MNTKRTICVDTVETPPGSPGPEKSTGQNPAGKPPARPPSPESARQLLAAAEHLAAGSGRAPDDMTDTDLSRLLRAIVPAEAALDRAALMVLGAARGRNVSWPRIGKALGLTADGARDRFDRACARHPDYTAPLAPTLGAHMAHANGLIAAIADPPEGFTRHAATRLLGAVLLTATLDQAPELVGHWLTDPTLSGAAAAAARHPKNDGAHKALTEFTRERPGTRADLLDIIREAVQDSPWAVQTTAPAAPALEAHGTPTTEAPTLEDLRDLARTWLREGSGPASEGALPGELPVAARRLGSVLLAATCDGTGLDEAVAHVVPHWLDRDHTLADALQALDARPRSHPDAGAAREALALHADDEPPIRARLVSLMRAALPDQAPASPPPQSTRHLTEAPQPREERALDTNAAQQDLDDLLNLGLLITDRVRGEDNPAGRVLRELAQAIDTGAPALLDKPMAAVATLEDQARTWALGADGARLWERVRRGRYGPQPTPASISAADAAPHLLGAARARDEHHLAQLTETTGAFAALVADAGLPQAVAGPLEQLHGAAAPHLHRSGPDRFPVLERLAELDRALRERDAHALAAAVHHLPKGGVDLFDASNLSGVGEPLGGVLLALDGHPPTTVPEPEPEPARRPGYARPLERAGLAPAVADALADPLTQLIGEATLVCHREVNPQTRQLMEALQPTLLSQNPARVRTLLYLLPRLNLIGLHEWAPLALAITEHAPHLEWLPSSAHVLDAAELPTHLAQDIDALVNDGRRTLVASWAPGAPAWQAGPALEQLTAAVEGGDADRLPAALEAVAELEQAANTGAGLAPELSSRWEDLAYSWRRARPAHAENPAAPVAQAASPWPDKAAHVLPDHPDLAAALAAFLDAVGGRAGVQDLSDLAKDQRAYAATYRLVKVVDNGDRPRIGDALEDVVKLKPTRAPFGKHRPDAAAALRALIDAYDHQ